MHQEQRSGCTVLVQSPFSNIDPRFPTKQNKRTLLGRQYELKEVRSYILCKTKQIDKIEHQTPVKVFEHQLEPPSLDTTAVF
jgi:hypothetical protein